MTRAQAFFPRATSNGATPSESGVHAIPVGRGAVLGGRYKLKARLADGGMATVWAGVDLVELREVVVKVLSVELLQSEEAVKRFVLEGDLIRAVTSKHIVAFIDHGVHGGAPYLVLERLDGEDLEHRLMHRRLSPGECATLLEQAALALLPAHARGIVHRDVKPANLFLAETEEGEVLKLLDFGVAKLREGTRVRTAAGQTVGSPEFMSPEQIEGRRDIDGRSDLFSLAGVAYACLTGRPPFGGDTIVDVFHAVLRGKFTPPSQVVADVPPELDAFFQQALAVDRAARFPNAAAMAAAFREIVEGLTAPAPGSVRAAPRHIPIAPAAPTQVMRTRQREVSHGLRSALVAAAAMAAVIGGSALAWSWLEEPAAPPPPAAAVPHR